MRKEFSKKIRRDAFMRAGGKCEACGAHLWIWRFHYDHVIPAALGGEATPENCSVLCLACHRDKSGKHDVPAIAKATRVRDRHLGIRKRSSFAWIRSIAAWWTRFARESFSLPLGTMLKRPRLKPRQALRPERLQVCTWSSSTPKRGSPASTLHCNSR